MKYRGLDPRTRRLRWTQAGLRELAQAGLLVIPTSTQSETPGKT